MASMDWCQYYCEYHTTAWMRCSGCGMSLSLAWMYCGIQSGVATSNWHSGWGISRCDWVLISFESPFGISSSASELTSLYGLQSSWYRKNQSMKRWSIRSLLATIGHPGSTLKLIFKQIKWKQSHLLLSFCRWSSSRSMKPAAKLKLGQSVSLSPCRVLPSCCTLKLLPLCCRILQLNAFILNFDTPVLGA